MTISAKRKKQAKEEYKHRKMLYDLYNGTWSGLTTSNHLQYLSQFPVTAEDINYKWKIMEDDNK